MTISYSTSIESIIIFQISTPIKSRNISTIKGELLPILIGKQFSKQKSMKDSMDCDNDKTTLLDFVPERKNFTGIVIDN